MKGIDVKEYCRITNCSPWLNLNHFDFEVAQEFLQRKGYDIITHTAPQDNVEHKRSVPGTGEVESIGRFTTEMTHVLAVVPGEKLPDRFTPEYLEGHRFSSVFQKELLKNILK
jgi:hypothetical protein